MPGCGHTVVGRFIENHSFILEMTPMKNHIESSRNLFAVLSDDRCSSQLRTIIQLDHDLINPQYVWPILLELVVDQNVTNISFEYQPSLTSWTSLHLVNCKILKCTQVGRASLFPHRRKKAICEKFLSFLKTFQFSNYFRYHRFKFSNGNKQYKGSLSRYSAAKARVGLGEGQGDSCGQALFYVMRDYF